MNLLNKVKPSPMMTEEKVQKLKTWRKLKTTTSTKDRMKLQMRPPPTMLKKVLEKKVKILKMQMKFSKVQ